MNAVLTPADLRAQAPAIFTSSKVHEMSDRYRFIDTSRVLDVLGDQGYYPVQATQDNPSSRDPRFVRHAVVLRHENVDVIEGEVVPQILLINSHNGRTRFSIQMGLFRFVCANGMVVGDKRFESRMIHTGDLLSVVIPEVAQNFAKQMNDLVERKNAWEAIEMAPRHINAFANKAAEHRFGSEGAKRYLLDDILATRRAADEGRSLWRVFNRVQENLTKGGIKGKSATGRMVASRELKGIQADLQFNANLWSTALDVESALA